MQWFHKTTALISLIALVVIGIVFIIPPTRQVVLDLATGRVPLLDNHGKLDADTIDGKTVDQLLADAQPVDAKTLAGHPGLYYLDAANITGIIDPSHFSAYDSLVADGHISAGSTIVTNKTPNTPSPNLPQSTSATPVLAGLGLAASGTDGVTLNVVTGEGIVLKNNAITAVLGDNIDLLAEVSGILPITHGGTGLAQTPAAGQFLIGSGSGYTFGQLAAGDGLTLTTSGNSYSYALDSTVCRTTGNCGSGSGISGIGTAGQLAFFTADDVLSSDSGLSWNNVSKTLTAGSIDAANYKINGQPLSTSNIAEGTNLYLTNARVSANADVTANTAARHDAATVADSATLDLTIVGQQISGSVIQSGIKTSLITNDAGFIANLDGLSTDNLTQGSTNLYSQWQTVSGGVNYAGGNVGVGVATPGRAVDVSGAASINNVLFGQLEGGMYVGRTGVVQSPVTLDNSSFASSWTTRDSSRVWNDVAMSGDGKNQTAVASNSGIYTSTNYGATWTIHNIAKIWLGIAMSADSHYQTAVPSNGQIYISTDYGNTWSVTDNTRVWSDIAMSSDGKYQTATVNGGEIYRSTDYGISWAPTATSQSWSGVDMSSDGKYQTATVNGDAIYTSSDYGSNWAPTATSQSWSGVDMSSDGKYQTATINGGTLFTSSDYGNSWTARDSSRLWTGAAVGSTGQYQIAVVRAGALYASVNYGATWTSKTTNNNWTGGVAMSTNGQYLTATNNGLLNTSATNSTLPMGSLGIGKNPTATLDVSGTGAFSGGLTAATFNGLSITNSGTNTLTIAAGKTLVVSNSLTLSGTDATSFILPTSNDTLAGLSAIQALTNKTINGLTISSTTGTLTLATAKTLTVSNSLAFIGTDGTTFTFPSTSGTVCTVETGCGGGGGVTANSLDFSELKDAMTLDASTSIDIGGYNLNTTGSGALAFGHTGLTSFAGNVSLGANTTLQVTGGTAFPGTPAEGQMFFRTDTAQMYTYANSKWQADRSSVTKIVAAADSQNKEKADYVADGAGGVDDGSVIASAISALPSGGGTVVLLEGTFYIDSTLYIRKSHVALIGQGRSTRLLRQFTPADNSDNGVIYVAGPFQAYDDITISNLQIDGNKTNYASTKNHGLYLGDSAMNSTYANLWIHDAAGRGINSPDFPSYTPYYNKIINNVVENNGAQGAYLNKFSYSDIQNNQFNTNGTVGLYVINSANSVISGNVARSNTTVGIDVYNVSSGTVISNNTVSASGTNGIVLEANNITAVGNTVTGSGAVSTGHGISVASNIYKNISILDNTVTSSSGNGINVSSANGLISGNNVSSNTGDGISVVTGVNNNQISNNYISANSGNGIYNYNNNGNQYTGNQVYNNTKHGIYIDAASINTVVSSNTITNNGGSSNYNSITLNGQSQNNHISDNMITDTAGTGYAIAITSNTAVNTYLSNNTFSGTGASSISNSGSGTVLANQLTDTTSNNLIFSPQGNVGLGTTSPTASLHIKAGLSSQLSGTFGVTFNTTSVTTSVDQTSRLQVGDSITFGAYPNNNFTIAAITSTTITLGSTYFGSTTAASTGFTQPTNLLQVDNFAGSTVFSIGKTGGLTLKGDITLSNGSLVWTGIGAPGLSAAGTAKAYFDSTSNTLKLSENGGAYADVQTSGRALTQSSASVSSATTLTALNGTVMANATAGAFTVTLPTAVGANGRQYTIIKSDGSGNTITVNTTSAQTINGSSSYILPSQYAFVTIISDGANWLIIGK